MIDRKSVGTFFRKIVGDETVAGEVIKDATGYVLDTTGRDILQPSIIRLSDSDCWKFYWGNDWIQATINRIVRDATKAEHKVVPKDISVEVSGRLAKRIKQVNKFLSNPNENKESFLDIRKKTITNLLIFGRACVEKVLDERRRVIEIYATHPEQVEINANKHGNLPTTRTYKISDPKGQKVDWLDIDQMIFMVLNPTTKSVYGTKILDAIANTVASDILRAVFNSNYFVNGAEAAGIMTLEGFKKKDLEVFERKWKASFRGAKNSHKVAIVNVPAKWVRMALTNKDMEFTEYGRELRAKIFANFQMQPFIVGINDGTQTRIDPVKQLEIYKDGAIRPILKLEAYHYTTEIIENGFGFTDIEVIFPTIDLTDMETQTKLDREDAEAGILVINEIRARRGLGKVPWGDKPFNLNPGGGQFDDQGNLIPPSGQTGKKPSPKYMKFLRQSLGEFSDTLRSRKFIPSPSVIDKHILDEVIDPFGTMDKKFLVTIKKLVMSHIRRKKYSKIKGVIDDIVYL